MTYAIKVLPLDQHSAKLLKFFSKHSQGNFTITTNAGSNPLLLSPAKPLEGLPPKPIILVAYKSGEPVGIAFEASRNPVPEFYRAVVSAESGKGLGSRLVNSFLEEAWKRGYPAVRAKTRLSNKAARKSYLHASGDNACPLRIDREPKNIAVEYANPQTIDSSLEATAYRLRIPHASLLDTFDEMASHGFKPRFWVKTEFNGMRKWYAVPRPLRKR